MAAFQEVQVQVQLDNIINENDVRGLDKNQDLAFKGKVEYGEDPYEWFTGCDGHGLDVFPNILKRAPWPAIMATPDSLAALLHWLKKYDGISGNTGATYFEAKLFRNRVETCTVGDSQIAVFVDQKLVYINTPHNFQNPLECERLRERRETGRVTIKGAGLIPKICGATTLKQAPGDYIYFENGDKIALSQSLGHDNVTGISPEKHTVFFEPGQEVCVLGGSDGLWEMVNTEGPDAEADMLFLATKSANEIAAMAETRWKQEWNFIWTDGKGVERTAVNRFQSDPRSGSSGYDDVSVCRMFIPKTEKVTKEILEKEADEILEKALEEMYSAV